MRVYVRACTLIDRRRVRDHGHPLGEAARTDALCDLSMGFCYGFVMAFLQVDYGFIIG